MVPESAPPAVTQAHAVVRQNAEQKQEQKPATQGLEKTEPRAVLASIDWPTNINAWGSLQSKIWKGHPKLPKGWIRIWSKSQDREYYMRLRDMKSTFEFNEVSAE